MAHSATVQSTTEIIQLIAALGIGSMIGSIITAIVTHWLSRRSERRELRVKVREEMSAVQELRWPVKDKGWKRT
jgi:hypothetical protein